MTHAVAYYRTSSASNVGSDKDSFDRQAAAVIEFATRRGYELVTYAYDAAVSGADAIHEREGFMELLETCRNEGIKVILVENASRFARDLYVQMTGHEMLKKLGIELIPVDAPDHFVNPTPTGVLIQQILGAVSQFEKAMVVSKLKHARDAKRERTGRCEGRKPAPEDHRRAAVRIQAALLDDTGRWSLRQIAEQLELKYGYLSPSGRRYSPSSVAAMLR